MGGSGGRDVVAAAAMRVVAHSGVRGLTHCAVDAEAGLPSGSAHARFATLDELISGVIDQLTAVDGAIWTELGGVTPSDKADFADRIARWVQLAVEREPVASRARLELFFAAPSRAAVGHYAIVDVMGVILDVLGVPEPGQRARLIVDLVSGTVMHHVAVRADEPVDTASLAAAVLRVLGR